MLRKREAHVEKQIADEEANARKYINTNKNGTPSFFPASFPTPLCSFLPLPRLPRLSAARVRSLRSYRGRGLRVGYGSRGRAQQRVR